MLKLYCVNGTKAHTGDPIINGHQTREMILEEVREVSASYVTRLALAINHLNPLVENVYRINTVRDSAQEFKDTLSSLNNDNVEACLTADRRFRAYVLEVDMFLDYWETSISHYKNIGVTTENPGVVTIYKQLFRTLTSDAYDNNLEYQLLDLIRNQTAHVQSPVNRIHIGINGSEAYSFRDVLLKDCKSGENKKKILRSQPEEIALSPLVDVTEQCLENIHAGLIDFQIDNLVMEEIKCIRSFFDYIISKGHLCKPLILMDDKEIPPNPYHIRDMRAYGYLLDRAGKKEETI